VRRPGAGRRRPSAERARSRASWRSTPSRRSRGAARASPGPSTTSRTRATWTATAPEGAGRRHRPSRAGLRGGGPRGRRRRPGPVRDLVALVGGRPSTGGYTVPGTGVRVFNYIMQAEDAGRRRHRPRVRATTSDCPTSTTASTATSTQMWRSGT
jgi:hypothetical protein